jgi:DNA-binding FadR family transcriptional regulator
LLEAGAAEAAASSIDDEALTALAACVDAMRGAVDAETFLTPDLAFHQIVHRASGNALLHALMNGLRTLTHASLVASASDPAARIVAADEHQRVVDALRARDGGEAGRAMRQHVTQARARARVSESS